MRLRTGLTSAMVLVLAGCQQLPGEVYPASHAQQSDPGNSMLGEACDGHDPTESQRLYGDSYLYVTADVRVMEGVGEVPYALASAPADRGVSQLTVPVFSRSAAPRCSGTALRTIVRRENDATYLDWWLEVSPEPGRATDPWRVNGRARLDVRTGEASSMQRFHAFGRDLVLRVSAKPGPAWLVEKHVKDLKVFEDAHPTATYAKPLPDERPGLTLKDFANPDFHQ